MEAKFGSESCFSFFFWNHFLKVVLKNQIMGLYSLGHMGGWALEWDCLDRPEGCTDTPTNGRSIN